jgi:nitrogen fixation NifU-like protein
MYSEKVMDHFMNPRNVGVIPDADGEGTEGNPTCGDVMKFTIKVKEGVIEDAKFQTFGCGAAIAVSSMVTELVKGKTLEEALALSKETVARELGGLPPQKMHCSNLGADALRKAIEDYRNKHGAAAPAAAAPEPEKAAKPAAGKGKKAAKTTAGKGRKTAKK